MRTYYMLNIPKSDFVRAEAAGTLKRSNFIAVDIEEQFKNEPADISFWHGEDEALKHEGFEFKTYYDNNRAGTTQLGAWEREVEREVSDDEWDSYTTILANLKI